MARQIRIDALAEECAVAPREVLKALIELGHFRYTRFNQQVHEDLAQQVRDRLGPAPSPHQPEAGRAPEVDLFARAMQAAGVERLDGRRGAAKAKGRARAKPKPKPRAKPVARSVDAPPQEPPEPPVEPQGRSEAVAAAPAGPEELPSSVPEPQAQPEAEVPSGGDRARIEALEIQLVQAREQRERLLEELRALALERDRLTLERDEAEATVKRLAASEGAQGDGLLPLMQRRGLRGLDEAGLALRALLAAHLLDGSLATLRAPDGLRLTRVLNDRLGLCCGRELCGTPEGVELVRVPPQRCELCGGEERPRIHHRFSDACLLVGITRVLVLGGHRWQHRWIEEATDRRLQLRLRSGARLAPEAALRDDLDWAQLVLLWDDGALQPALVEATAGRPRVEVAGSLAGFVMAQAVERIEALEPTELP